MTQALAAPSIRFTLNGAKEAYNAGSVFMLYGRAEDSGLALPDANVLVKLIVETARFIGHKFGPIVTAISVPILISPIVVWEATYGLQLTLPEAI